MHIRQITDEFELSEIAPQWRRLAAGRPMLGPEWLATWWRYYRTMFSSVGGAAELCVLCVYDDDEVTALAPWFVEKSLSHGRILKFLGSGAVCTDYLTILSKPGWSSLSAEAITQWLAGDAEGHVRGQRQGPSRWDMLHFDCVSPADETLRSLLANLERRGAMTDMRPAANCWKLKLPNDWEDYLQILSKSHRKRTRRLEREYFDSGRIRLKFARTRQQIELAYSLLTSLHGARWDSKGEVGAFDDATFSNYHREVIDGLHDAGQLRLSWLELDAQPIAADYSISDGHTLHLYQSGMAPEASRHQPGNLALMALIRSAMDEGYELIDFLRGDEPYKQHWRADPHANVEVRIFPGRWPHRLRHSIWLATSHAKRWAKHTRQAVAR